MVWENDQLVFEETFGAIQFYILGYNSRGIAMLHLKGSRIFKINFTAFENEAAQQKIRLLIDALKEQAGLNKIKGSRPWWLFEQGIKKYRNPDYRPQ